MSSKKSKNGKHDADQKTILSGVGTAPSIYIYIYIFLKGVTMGDGGSLKGEEGK
jgi:hypothetical protein